VLLPLLLPLLVIAVPLLPWVCAHVSSSEAQLGVVLQLVGLACAVDVLRRPADTLAPEPAWLWPLVIGAGLALGLGLVVDVRVLQAAAVCGLAFVAAVVSRPVDARGATARALLPALSLLCLGLPLSGDVDVIGFPLRTLAAHVASWCLPGTMSLSTVLSAEGSLADVDVPCAGLSTVRVVVGAALVLGHVHKSPPRAWTIAALSALGVAVVVNVVRVTVLAALVLVAHRVDLARLVHVPLGVFAVLLATFAAHAVLRAWPQRVAHDVVTRWPTLPRGVLVPLAVLCVVLRGVVPDAHATTTAVVDGPVADELPLSPPESALFAQHALSAHKRRVDGGTALVVVASSLRAHHAPERCLAANGFRVDTASDDDTFAGPLRRLMLDGGAHVGLSFYVGDDDGTRVIARDLGTRVWLTLTRRIHTWAFVSVVVEADAPHLAPTVQQLADDAYARVQPHVQARMQQPGDSP
jgi:exosortase O